MKTIKIQQPINLKVVRFELDFTSLVREEPAKAELRPRKLKIPQVNFEREKRPIPPAPVVTGSKSSDAHQLVEELLDDLYASRREWSTNSACSRGSTSAPSLSSSQSLCEEHRELLQRSYFEDLDACEVLEWRGELQQRVAGCGERLARALRRRERLRRARNQLCARLTHLLRLLSGDSSVRFGVPPGGGAGGVGGDEGPGEGGFTEWLHAMRLVARLPAGVPQHFRKKLWLALAERHLRARGVEWAAVERACFRGSAMPIDAQLGAQIIKDLHRTGCSLFCGSEGRENQAMLRRVLLAYARWNKEVGYCQGFNMLAAIILEVMEKSESDSLKVMIYLVEAVLPEGYFADDLRGLAADMAAFRDLLRLRLPRLAAHMDRLQAAADGGASGAGGGVGGVEPPLPDVFTMQWLLTLYATWLPRAALLRLWDLVLLDGNELLLLAALAIWDMLQDRILSARSADEFYSCMGGGAGAIYEAGDALIAKVVELGSAPELPRLRNAHRYRVSPPAPPAPLAHHTPPPLHSTVQSMTKRGLRLFYSEDEGESSDDGNKMALATMFPRGAGGAVSGAGTRGATGAGDRLSLDIGALKRQYARLRERQRQAHVILAAACARHAAVGVPTSPTSLTVNNLLMGKSAIVSSRGRRLGPPPGAVPPTRNALSPSEKPTSETKGRSSDTISWNEEIKRKSLSRRNSLKWKDIKKDPASDRCRKASIDLDESGDGVIVSDLEADAMIASVRARACSESSSYSSHSSSSSDTSLCDDNISDTEHDLTDRDKVVSIRNKTVTVSEIKETKISTPIPEVNVQLPDIKADSPKAVRNIDDYLDSVAGEPLRNYIDGFEDKTKEKVCQCKHRATKVAEPIKFNELSPMSPVSYNFRQFHVCHSRYSKSNKPVKITRPPDVIDSLARYPNFVPDIELSDNSGSEFDSPRRSPDNESIIISEDERPIPLKIDKYFEHSPEFFGARITDPNSIDIPSRRTARRDCRSPKKPDSLTLKTSHNTSLSKSVTERASSLPQSHSFKTTKTHSPYIDKKLRDTKLESITHSVEKTSSFKVLENQGIAYPRDKAPSPKDYMLQAGRKNSEKALQIIQENSKILNRILTKQTNTISEEKKRIDSKEFLQHDEDLCLNKDNVKKLTEFTILKESTSDSTIRFRKKDFQDALTDKTDILRSRPISIDGSSLDPRLLKNETVCETLSKTLSNEGTANKTDIYGWENKGFLAKYDLKATKDKSDTKYEYDYKLKSDIPDFENTVSQELRHKATPNLNRHSYSEVSKPTSLAESSNTSLYDRKTISDDYNFSLTNKYNDFVLSKASDICGQMVTKEPKLGETLKTDNSQVSDISNIVTSSISFTYEPSQEDDSPIGAKSNSSDTLCQITSLDQVSTPISPKIFYSKETGQQTKDCFDKSDKSKLDSEGTCSAITSLMETDTLSSLSYPRSPSTGSYHPFPTRQSVRVKELGVKLGMYPKDSISSPPN